MNMQLLPIGSVVTLHSAQKKIMIIGVFASDATTNKTFDYIGIPYPEGFIDGKTMFLFMHKDINHIDFLGYVDAEFQAFRTELFKDLEARGMIKRRRDDTAE